MSDKRKDKGRMRRDFEEVTAETRMPESEQQGATR